MTHERPVVLVDMDGVLADFNGGLETSIKQIHPEFVPPDRALSYWLSKRSNHPFIQNNYDTIKNAKGFFRNLPAIDDALEGWQRIVDLGYYPRVCTMPLVSNIYCVAEKLEWLEEHLGAAIASDAIFDGEKWKYPGITLIDDNPEIENTHHASWVHTVFDHPYNHQVETGFRLEGWLDPNLPNLLARCAERATQSSRT